MADDVKLSTCLYGDPKVGKTTAIAYVAPDAFYMGPKDSAVILPVETLTGVRPPFQTISHIGHIGVVAQHAKKLGYTKLVVDDMSHLAATSENYWRTTVGTAYGKATQAIRVEMQSMLTLVCNQLGMDVFFTAHERAAQGALEGRKAMRGGPKLPAGFQEDLPSYVDLVYRVQHSANSPRGLVRFGFPYIVRAAGGDPDYTTGDRINVAPDCANLNLGEIFRASALTRGKVRRPPQWEGWIEPAVEHYARLLVAAEKSVDETARINGELYARGMEAFKGDPRPVRWALNDASARAYLKTNSLTDNLLRSFTGLGNLSSVPAAAAAGGALSMDSSAPSSTGGSNANGAPPTNAQPIPELKM